jgi:chloramphenicol O-acetyltransferase type A
MRTIDIENWSRGEHFRLFNNFNHPHFSMCANVDVTEFYPFVKQHHYSFTVTVVYVIARAANAIPEFRQRIHGKQVVEYEVVHPGFTILVSEDIFTFCTIEYEENFPTFAERAAEGILAVKTEPTLEEDRSKDDVLYMSPIPWVSFTSFNHPMQLHPGDTIPRFAWGKYFKEGDRLMMPLQVQGHHALMDGIHMGRFYEKVQETLYHPETTLGEV